MTKMEVVIIADYTESTLLDAAVVCHVCACSLETLLALLDYDIIQASAQTSQGDLLFDAKAITMLKMALRLLHDFDLNLSGLALVMDLIAEREALLERNALLERHLFGNHS